MHTLKKLSAVAALTVAAVAAPVAATHSAASDSNSADHGTVVAGQTQSKETHNWPI